jgi:hypothetical protein
MAVGSQIVRYIVNTPKGTKFETADPKRAEAESRRRKGANIEIVFLEDTLKVGTR